MNELIKITESNGKQAVSARELYKFLEATERFNNWFERQLQYGFVENIDYVGCKQFNTLANQELNDYALTINCAKEISMLQRNEKGKQARQYFIEAENKYRQLQQTGGFQIPKSYSEALKLAASQAEQIEQQQKQIQQQAPKVLFADSVSASHTSILIGDLAKILKQNGVEIGAKRLFVWMRRNGYLIKKPGMSYNMPSQRGMNLNLFEIKETVVTHSDGHTSINKTVKVTGTGQIYFVNKFLKQKELV
jgi:anti-repressor protein